MTTEVENPKKRKREHAAMLAHNDGVQPSTSSNSVNQLKSKIRDITRALKHSDRLPPGIRIEKERALTGYKEDLENAMAAKRRQQMIKKYHMVRFFERQKATRNLKRVKAQLQNHEINALGSSSLRDKLHDAEVDLNYTIYYPLDTKYVSLFPRSRDDTGGDQQSGSGSTKPHLWKLVENCMKDDSLDLLREGKIGKYPSSRERLTKHNETPSARKMGSDNATRESTKQDASSKLDDNESDGGFFEE